jgi:hypothetical protein
MDSLKVLSRRLAGLRLQEAVEMKLGYTAAVVMLACAVAAAQDVKEKTKTKVSVEDGKEITVTGCVARGAERGFTLTNVAGKDGAMGSYALVGDEADDVEKHIGHRVEITGKAADQGKGKLKVETKTELKVKGEDTKKTESKSEMKGDLPGLPFLAVKSVRMLASVCP